MTILVCHEAGHFLQARRYGVHTSFPYFIPMPITPFGTAGAVIGMSSQIKDRRALYDIGITGPLAGLVPTIFFCIVGLSLSRHAFLSEAMRSEGSILWRAAAVPGDGPLAARAAPAGT